MLIESIRVQNYRSIRDETLHCKPLVALVGANGTGKSSFLAASELFRSSTENITLEDYYNCNPTDEIVITMTYYNLSSRALELFDKYVVNKTLTVEKVIAWNDGKPRALYHGATLQNPDFEKIRAGFEIRDRGATARAALEALRESGKYDGLPQWTTISETKQALTEWEEEHPHQCERKRDDGQFFGFRQVGQGYLGQFTRCLFIPAVRDAPTDAIEGRGSVFTSLIDLVVRNTLATREEIQDLLEKMKTEYEQILIPENLPELGNLASNLSTTLNTFVPNAQVELNWLPLGNLEFPTPRADIRLVEDGYASPVDKCGHGLQRAFIVTLLQHLTVATAEDDIDEEDEDAELEEEGILPDLLLLIEEPELYQHPNRQRHFSRILWELAKGRTPGVADQTQIIYSTHSPHFVGIDRIDNIRLFRKKNVGRNFPKETEVVKTSLDDIARRIWIASGSKGEPFTAKTLFPRLVSIMTPWMSEGFFAEVAVLVEGEDDRAAILGMAMVMEYDFNSLGISVIPCVGKTNIDRPTAIFQGFGIPVYGIWDGDSGNANANPSDNHRLLRLFGADPIDWPSAIEENYSCFAKDLETTLFDEIGRDKAEKILKECQDEFVIPKRKYALKNPYLISEMIRRAEETGIECITLRKVVQSIILLHDRTKE
jgi:hypothetical protein